MDNGRLFTHLQSIFVVKKLNGGISRNAKDALRNLEQTDPEKSFVVKNAGCDQISVKRTTKAKRKVLRMANDVKELPYERIAMAGGEMPDDLEWYDRQMFLMLRTLYWQFKKGIVDRETASREKRKIIKDRDFQLFQDNFTKNIAKKIVDTEKARQAYRKNRTLENADAIILAFEGVPVTFNEGVL